MGREEDGAPVDPKTLKLHGLDGIRVCDASIFPILPAGCVRVLQASLIVPTSVRCRSGSRGTRSGRHQGHSLKGSSCLRAAPLTHIRR